MILITDNGTGKTFNATKWVLEGVLKGINGAWVRNTEIESKSLVNQFESWISKLEKQAHYHVKKEGVFEIASISKSGVVKCGKMVVGFVYLSSLSRSVPQELHARRIVIDEFIDGNTKNKFSLKNFNGEIKKAINRLTRPIWQGEKVFTLMLANPHTPQSDVVYSFFDFDWDKLYRGETDFQINKQKRCVGICIPKQFKIKEMKANYEYWGGEQEANNYSFAPNKYKIVLPQLEAENDFKIICKLTLNLNDYLLCFCEAKNIYFMKELTSKGSFVDVEAFAVKASDLTIYNKFIVDKELYAAAMMKWLNPFFNHQLYFNTDFSYEEFRKVAQLVIKIDEEGLYSGL